jgi:dipeptidyl aminopeptidase/acylaminoacyl peptidase
MKYFIIGLIVLMRWGYCVAQKPVMSIIDCEEWPEVRAGAKLSHDGKFVYYAVEDELNDNPSFIQSIEAKWKLELHGISSVSFSNDSKHLYGILKGDTLLTVDLYSHLIKKASNIQSYVLFTQSGIEWLITKEKKPRKSLTLNRLNSTRVLSYSSVFSHFIADDGNSIVIEKDSVINGNNQHQLIWIDLINYQSKVVYVGNNIDKLTIDDRSQQLAFFVKKNDENQIWYCTREMKEATLLVSDQTYIFKDKFNLDPSTGYLTFQFSQNGKSLFFGLREKSLIIPNPDEKIFSYKDAYLQNKFTMTGIRPKTSNYFASLNLENKQLIRLLNQDEEWEISYFENPPDKYIIVEKFVDSPNDKNYDIDSRRRSYYLRSTESGNSYPIKIDCDPKDALSALSLSPNGKYVVFYDREKGRYCTYSLEDKVIKTIAIDVNENLTKYNNFNVPDSIHGYLVGVAGWLSGDTALWINGRYNIWQVDPNGKKPSINLTGKTGLQDSVVYYLPNNRYKISVDENKSVMLSAFNLKDKKLGFFDFILDKKIIYNNIIFGARYFPNLDGYNELEDGVLFMKAKRDRMYVFRFETVSDAPNYFYTRDFKRYKKISDYQPQRKFNWITSELHKYTDKDGQKLEGVLYKPENFNPQKKYPVIFFYYENKSHELNKFINPSGFDGINIPLLVSNGYLIFKPDIYSLPTKVGEGALKSVNAAADYLSTLSYIDSSKMALSGHSFGGYETNYIVTHSNRFAAAISAAGVSNLINNYYRMDGDFGVRTGQSKMVFKPYEYPNLYIENSPIFFVDKVTTPLLILQNTEDFSVSFDQGFYFFNELRKAKKKVWMLSYVGEGHGLNRINFLSYCTKTLEFFDHFLKGKTAPKWID